MDISDNESGVCDFDATEATALLEKSDNNSKSTKLTVYLPRNDLNYQVKCEH